MFSKRLLLYPFAFSLLRIFSVPRELFIPNPKKDDSRRMVFEVIGKIDGNFLIYKNLKSKSWITVYDNDMKEVSKVALDFVPDDRLISVDFFSYNDFFYAIYQYQRKNVVYCKAVKADGKGKNIRNP